MTGVHCLSHENRELNLDRGLAADISLGGLSAFAMVLTFLENSALAKTRTIQRWIHSVNQNQPAGSGGLN